MSKAFTRPSASHQRRHRSTRARADTGMAGQRPGPVSRAPQSGRERMSVERWQSGDQLSEGQGVAHLVCVGKRTRDAESLAFEQVPGSRVLGTGDSGKPADPRNCR